MTALLQKRSPKSSRNTATSPPSALVLYLYLLAIDRGNEQPPSQRTLSERTGICPATVREHLDTLQQAGLVQGRRDQRDRRYKIYESNAAKR